MSDIEKAIDNLNFIKHNDFNDNIKQYKRIGVNSIDLAISALEKQIPYEVDCRDVVNIRWTDGYCKCGRYVTNSMSCCINCGQKLDWEVENED